MPILLRRFDHAKMYNTCMSIWPFAFIFLPALNGIARLGAVYADVPGLEEEVMINTIVAVTPFTKALLWCGIAILLSMSRIACLAFS